MAQTTVTGFVYKDVNADSWYDPSVDIPIPGAIVKASTDRVIAAALTDTSGKYRMSIPQSILRVRKLTVTLPAGVSSAEPGDPTSRQWKTDYSTVRATATDQNTQIDLTYSGCGRPWWPVHHDIAVDYLPLNYGPPDCSYELWHFGPIFSGKQNAVLVHGIQTYLYAGPGYVRGSADNLFGGQSNTYGGLAKLLQDKSNILDGDFYNVWDFEYADALHYDGKYYTDSSNTAYGERLADVLKNVAQWTGTSQGATIIAHSMGGLVARCAVQLSPAEDEVADKVANIIFLDSPGIFGGQFGGFLGSKNLSHSPGLQPGLYEILAGSELLWRVNSDYAVSEYTFKVLTLVAGVFGTLEDSSEGHANGRLVKCGPDGSVIQGSQSAFAVVKGKDHIGIMKISDADNVDHDDGVNHPSFKCMQQFLNGGAFTESPNGKPTFTFVFTTGYSQLDPALTGGDYPKVWVPPNDTCIQRQQMIGNTYNIDGTTYYAWTIQAEASEYGTMKIYWDATHYVTATLTQWQSAIRKEVIDN